MIKIVQLVVCAFLWQQSCGYKIVGIFPAPSKSHYYIGHALMKGLAAQGHEVTVISPFQEKKPIKNYKEVFLEHSWDMSRQDLAKDNFVDFNDLNFLDMTLRYYDLGDDLTNWTISSHNFQNFLRTKQHFDVVIVEMCLVESLLGLGYHYNAPIIATSAFGASKWTTDLVGTPNFASYVPHTNNHYSDRMSFWQRLYNSVMFWTEDILMPIYHLPNQQKAMEKLFPDAKKWPSIQEIRKNVSLVLLNTHVSFGTPRPYAPNMIEVGGMQIKQTVDPLPEKIQKFLDEAKNGAIYFSLGSNVLVTKLPEHQIRAITNAFRDHPNVRILIKSDENIVISSHKESDVLIEPWFNQHSILAHPNVRVFVTHGGLLSTTESVHFGKPVVGIPFFFDQHLNMQIAEDKGFGISVPIEKLDAKKIKSAINEILRNPSYTETAKITSDRYRDQLKTPLETAIHWVNHVAKNKGAPHLRSVAVELPFYQLYNLDCWLFVCTALVMMTVIVKLSFSYLSSQIKIKQA